MNSQDLDRHITGNYGEDQFNRAKSFDRSFYAGAKARKKGLGLDSCRCKTPNTITGWKHGWHDEDVALRAEEEEGD
jgi:hypothetical protein